MYFTLMFAGVALMGAVFVGVAVAKWKASRSPHAQGFVEVDQVSMELERNIKFGINIDNEGFFFRPWDNRSRRKSDTWPTCRSTDTKIRPTSTSK